MIGEKINGLLILSLDEVKNIEDDIRQILNKEQK